MPKPKSETIGSYVIHNEVLRCGIEQKDGHRRWSCSCGIAGKWHTITWDKFQMYKLVDSWKIHLRLDHPDYWI